jgi:hypothetical protein
VINTSDAVVPLKVLSISFSNSRASSTFYNAAVTASLVRATLFLGPPWSLALHVRARLFFVSPGTPGSGSSQPSTESRRAFKYPYVACEVFCCEVDPIFTTLQESEELMAKLFSILDQPRPLDCVLAGTISPGLALRSTVSIRKPVSQVDRGTVRSN